MSAARISIAYLLAGLAAMASIASMMGRAQAETVNASIVNVASDVPFYIAEKKGYFRDEGLTVQFTVFDSAAKMIPSLGAGQLDVGGGATSAGLYNAVARGIGIKIVADKAHDEPGYSYSALMVRKDLIDSGRFKTFADLKGLKIAMTAAGNSENSAVNQALKRGGLKYSDIEPVYMGFPQHAPAFANRAIDASLTSEPALTFIGEAGLAALFARTVDFYPNKQTAVLYFGAQFIKSRPETAKKFMRAYIRAARFYNDALKDGRLAGPNGEEVIAMLTESSRIKDANVYRKITPHAFHADGKVNLESIRLDWQFFKDQGLLQGAVTPDDVFDVTIAAAAAAELGPYRPAGQKQK